MLIVVCILPISSNMTKDAGRGPMGYHSHNHADAHPDCGFIRVFFYLNGFKRGDGNLKVVPGSHLFRTNTGHGATDDDIEAWAKDKIHPLTGEPLAIQQLECPPSSVVVMWTHVSKDTHCFGLWSVPRLATTRTTLTSSITADCRLRTALVRSLPELSADGR